MHHPQAHQQPHAVATAASYFYSHPSPLFSPLPHHYHDPSLGGPFVYRPVQVPLQTQHHHHLQQRPQQQQQQPQLQHSDQQQQLSLAAAAAAVTGYKQQQHPIFRPRHAHSATIPARRSTRAQSRQQQQQSVMAHQQTSEEELEQMHDASSKWVPEVTGPLVGPRQPSTALTSEYANADPVYQAKTTTLPQKYSYYRTVRGDGRCGWRAVAFCYFETLARFGDTGKFVEEETRLRSLGNVVQQAGYSQDMLDDFFEEVWGLLRQLTDSIAAQDGRVDEILEAKFNDEMVQNYIITYFRTLTAAWMKTREAEYAPWLDQTVESYCQSHIEPMAAEMDHVGLTALRNVLLSPAGISLEVLYLDRSEGDEVNMHRWDPIHANGYTTGSVRLLYRPGHYDILYKPEDLPPPLPPAIVPTYLMSPPQHEPIYDMGVSDVLQLVPGMSYVNPWMASGYSQSSDLFGSTPVQPCAPAVPTPAPQTHVQAQPVYVPTPATASMVAPPVQMPQELAIRTAPPPTTLAQAHNSFQHQLSGPFRPSAWELDPHYVEASQMPFQTSIFRNSHYNQAHFLNPDFQPEQWDPEDEYGTLAPGSKNARHRNSG